MKMRPVLVLSLLTALLTPFLSATFADQDFKNVSPAELKANPQNYWARGVIFNDVMVAGPGGALLRVENRDCTPITLKVAGTCYVEPALLPVIKELPLQQSYIFRGTVLQAKAPGSWFFGSKVYLILITGVEATVDTEKMSQNFMKMYDRVDQVPPKGSTQAMTALLLEVQTALAKYAREKEMPLEQLLADDSESSKKAIGIIYEAIHTQESRSKTTAEEILASYILAFLRAQYQPQSAAPDIAPVLTNTPAPTPINIPTPAPQEAVAPVPGPVPVIEPAPVDVHTNSAIVPPQEPPKKSWLQRRRERQAEEAAAAAELKRIEQEKRLQEKEAERIREEQERQAREELQMKQQAEREEKARLAAEAKEAKRKAAAAKREEERQAREAALKQQEAEKAEQARLAAEAEEAERKAAELKAAEELRAREEAEQARLAAEANERKAAEAKREEQRNAQEEAQRLEETEQADQARLLAEKEAFEKKASMQSSEEQPQAPLPEQPADSEDLNAPVGL